eukprot:7055371-Pyramimonas_sp.AAC.1
MEAVVFRVRVDGRARRPGADHDALREHGRDRARLGNSVGESKTEDEGAVSLADRCDERQGPHDPPDGAEEQRCHRLEEVEGRVRAEVWRKTGGDADERAQARVGDGHQGRHPHVGGCLEGVGEERFALRSSVFGEGDGRHEVGSRGREGRGPSSSGGDWPGLPQAGQGCHGLHCQWQGLRDHWGAPRHP